MGRVSGFGFRVSGFGFRVSGFGFRVSGFGFRVSSLGVMGEGLECRVEDHERRGGEDVAHLRCRESLHLPEKAFFIKNLLVRIHVIIEMT